MATRSCRKANRRGSGYLVPTRQRREVLLVAGGQLRPDGVPLRGDDGRRRRPRGAAARARPHGGRVPRLQRVPAQRHVLALSGAGAPAAPAVHAGEPAHLLRPARGREERAHPRKLLPGAHQPGSVAHGVRRARIAEASSRPCSTPTWRSATAWRALPQEYDGSDHQKAEDSFDKYFERDKAASTHAPKVYRLTGWRDAADPTYPGVPPARAIRCSTWRAGTA